MLGPMSKALLLVALVAATLGACGKKSDDGPACGAVVDNMMTVTKQQMTGHGQLEVQNRGVMVEQCEKRKLTAAQRTCLVAAKDLPAIAACTPRPSAPPPATP